jgi:hypothetical protein
MTGDLYQYIDSWDGQRVFIYVVIFLVIFWFISRQNLGISTLIAIIIGAFAINYMNFRSIKNSDTQEDIKKIKEDAIVPKVSEDTKEQNDIINFLFSIQDMFSYSPRQYIDMVTNINYFYDLYKMSFVDKLTSYTNYDRMKQYKCNALNALMSIIYSLPEDRRLREKIGLAASTLDEIMTKHLDQISYIMDEYTYKHGYSVDTKIIDYGPKAANEYEDMFKNYSYEIY